MLPKITPPCSYRFGERRAVAVWDLRRKCGQNSPYCSLIWRLDSTVAQGLKCITPDIRVRFPPLEESDLVMKVLAHSPQRIVASPALIGRLSLPLLPTDLSHLPSLAWGPPHRDYEWQLEGPDGAIARIPHKPRLITEDMVTLRLAALRGVGIAQMPTIVAGADLAAGALVNLLSGWAPKTGTIHAVFPSRRGLLPSVRALLDFLALEYAALEDIEARGPR